MVPIELVEACADHKSWLFVYIWLWHYAGKDNADFPSMERLAAECHMASRDVRRALSWLVKHGWIKRVERPGRVTLFHVRTERQPRKRSSRSGSQLTPPPNGGYPKKATPEKATPPPKRPGVEALPLPQKGQGLAAPLPQMGDTSNPPPKNPPKTKTEELKPIKPIIHKTNPPSGSLRSPDRPPRGLVSETSPDRSAVIQAPEQQPTPSVSSDVAPEAAGSPRKAPQPTFAATDTTTPSAGPLQARTAATKAAATLPAFAEPVRPQLQAWWRLRQQRHRAKSGDGLTARSVSALTYANELGVLEAFADLAAESGWLSLGFSKRRDNSGNFVGGYRELIESLAAEHSQNPLPSHSGSCMVGSRTGGATSRQAAAADRAIAMFASPIPATPVEQCFNPPPSLTSWPG